MSNLILVLGGALILIILILLFRVGVLISVLRGNYKQQVDPSNKVNAILFPVFFFVLFGLMLWYSPIAAKYFLPESASEHGVITDKGFWVSMAIIMFVFFVTHILLFFFPYIYQYKKERRADYFPDNAKLEMAWTIIPAIVLTYLVYTGWQNWSKIQGEAPKEAVELEIMGKQFAWAVRYPGPDGKLGHYKFKLIDATNEFGMDLSDKASFDDFMPVEIHIPVNTPVKFNIRAKDVIHSVFLPHFRQKMDAVPGMPTTFWFTPKYTTAEMRQITDNPKFKYELACTEICGRGHFAMRYVLVVDTPEEYKKWASEQQSWLSQNPNYLEKVPVQLRKFTGIEAEGVVADSATTAQKSSPAKEIAAHN